jgi:hypothetical protein
MVRDPEAIRKSRFRYDEALHRVTRKTVSRNGELKVRSREIDYDEVPASGCDREAV